MCNTSYWVLLNMPLPIFSYLSLENVCQAMATADPGLQPALCDQGSSGISALLPSEWHSECTNNNELAISAGNGDHNRQTKKTRKKANGYEVQCT